MQAKSKNDLIIADATNPKTTVDVSNPKPNSPRLNVPALMTEADSYEKAASFDKAIQIYNRLIQFMPA